MKQQHVYKITLKETREIGFTVSSRPVAQAKRDAEYFAYGRSQKNWLSGTIRKFGIDSLKWEIVKDFNDKGVAEFHAAMLTINADVPLISDAHYDTTLEEDLITLRKLNLIMEKGDWSKDLSNGL